MQLSTCVTVSCYRQYVALNGVEVAGLVSPPPAEPFLVA